MLTLALNVSPRAYHISPDMLRRVTAGRLRGRIPLWRALIERALLCPNRLQLLWQSLRNRRLRRPTLEERRQVLRRRLEENWLSALLVDTEALTLHLETAYSAMYERHQAGLHPEHIEIARLAAVRRRVRRQRIPLRFKLSGTYDSRAC